MPRDLRYISGNLVLKGIPTVITKNIGMINWVHNPGISVRRKATRNSLAYTRVMIRLMVIKSSVSQKTSWVLHLAKAMGKKAAKNRER